VGIGDVPNVNDVRRDLGDGAPHDIVDVVVCGELCSGGGMGMGFCGRAEDEAGVNYEILFFQNFSKMMKWRGLARYNIELRIFLNEFPEGSLCQCFGR
jgi:hypothetical protein